MLKCQSNSRQVPKRSDICSNKNYCDSLYSYLQCISKMEKSGNRYIDKRDINFSKISKILGMSRQTVSKKFKNLLSEEMDLIKLSKKKYYLNKISKEDALLIPYATLKILVDTLNQNTINFYTFLLNYYFNNNQQSFCFTFEQAKANLGLCITTRSNDSIITNMLFVLKRIGLIDYRLERVNKDCMSLFKSKTIYRITWMTNIIKY